MSFLANAYYREGKYPQAEALDGQVLETRRRVLGSEHPDTLESLVGLAGYYDDEGKYAQAEALDSQVLEIQRRILGPEHRLTLLTMGNLASEYLSDEKYAQAEALFSQNLEMRRRVLGEGNPDTLWAMRSLAATYSAEGKCTQADELYRKAVELRPNKASSLNALAWYLLSVPDRRCRRPEEALQLARRAVQAAPNVATNYNTLGLAEYRNGLWDEAIASLNKSAELNRGAEPTDFFFLSMAHWKRDDKAEAARFFQQGVDIANSRAVGSELRIFWAEAAELLGRPGPKAGTARNPR